MRAVDASFAPPPLRRLPDDRAGKERERNEFNPPRKLYNTARWGALRLFVLARNLFNCPMCDRIEGDIEADGRP
ncbi:hypothetical protein [Sphingomonas crocodyli]|uniref:hypothetical protein n=1 Tax=Sphingomonas crocodyli TaxID=1979270 RepID=UPI0019D0143F|nr:hypothetical protein [Sphingomonas crocodyli]